MHGKNFIPSLRLHTAAHQQKRAELYAVKDLPPGKLRKDGPALVKPGATLVIRKSSNDIRRRATAGSPENAALGLILGVLCFFELATTQCEAHRESLSSESWRSAQDTFEVFTVL